MRKSVLIWRAILTFLVLCLFTYTAYYLYEKQKLKLDYLSFQLENPTASFIVPDIDRLIDKVSSPQDLTQATWQPTLEAGIQSAMNHKSFSFNREIAKDCFFSFNETDFVLVFNTSTSISSLIEIVNQEFQIEAKYSDGKIKLNGASYFADHYGNYLAVSSGAVNPIETQSPVEYGNADYIEFKSGDKQKMVQHILSTDYHFSLWEESSEKLQGKAVNHSSYFASAPADFDQVVFYGSTRITEDAHLLFAQPNEGSFAWLSDGLLYARKGEFEIVIAIQGDSPDLSLLLEEQTVNAQEDSLSLDYFNIGKFKIMPFRSTFNWTESIEELKSELNYYTEFKNFNVMSNDIPAMRWYLGQIQLGNLIANNQLIYKTYLDCLPETSHFVSMNRDSESGYTCESRIYQRDSSCIFSVVNSGVQDLQMEGVEVVYDFSIEIVPQELMAFSENEADLVLANNSTEIALYNVQGDQKWRLNLSTPLVEKPVRVDFENDGISEFVLFQSNQVDVVGINGKSLPGFPAKYNGTSTAGLAVNYDNLFKYRLIVNVGNTVKVYSEEGKIVDGWMFKGMDAALQGKIYHVITEGKDIITFKDTQSRQYVLNRRGEYRIEEPIIFKLPAESDFVIGSLGSALRKVGYKDGYIYNYYILDGLKDSVKIDQTVSPIATYWEYNSGKPLLIVEEPGRLLIVNEFGYVQSEVLKPNQSNEFVGLVGTQEYGFVFADNSQNTIYLLNNYGKMILPQAVKGSSVSVIQNNLLYSFSGINIKAFKIAD